MRWYGKALGFLAGWLLLRHPAGGVLGALIGHVFDAELWRGGRKNPYAVLELSESATNAEIDSAYQKLLLQYESDRLSNLAKDLREQAAKRVKEIRWAYQEIQNQRGKQ